MRVFPLAVCLLLTSCGGNLAVVGFGQDGKSVETFLSESAYAKRLTESLAQVEESVLPALAAPRNESEWKLKTASIGFGVKGEAGIGPFRVAVKPRIRATFTKDAKP